MSLALESLVFQVETDKLLKAKEAIDSLAVSMSNLNKVQTQEAKVAKDSVKAKESLVKSTEESTESTKKNLTVLERQQAILEFMTQGFSKGQSSVLAYAKSSGALTQELKELGGVLQTQRKLIGGDSFDKSLSGLIALKNQYGEIREAIRQYNSDMDLTRNQTRELARDKERIIEKLKLEGKSFTEVKNAIREYNQVYTDQANKVNSLLKVEKDRERSLRDHANAIRNVQSAEERLFATVSHINDGLSSNANLNERAALAVGSYERNLRLAGITGEVAAKKLMTFKNAQEQVTAVEQKRQASYISRGTAVQLGDVGVSLAGGQNPLMVMIQQGDQLAGLLAQAGRDGLNLKNVMTDAFSQMANSYKQVGIAMGAFVGGAFKTLGDGLFNVANKFFKVEEAALSFGIALTKYGADDDTVLKALSESLGYLRTAFAFVAGVGIAAFASVAIAMVQTTKANNAVTASLLQYGAILGVTRDELIATANESAKFGSSSNEVKGFFAELIKGGVSSKESLKLAADAATYFASVTGESLSEISKRYTGLGKDPVKVLTELAQNTGLVDLTTLRAIESLVKQGNTLEANKQSAELYSKALTQLATDQYNALSPLEQLWIQVKIAGGDAWESIVKFANNESIVNALKGIALSAVAVVSVLRELGQTAISAYKALSNPLNMMSVWEDYKAQIAIIRKESSDLANDIIFGKGGVDTAGRQENSEAAKLKDNADKASDSLRKLADSGDKLSKYRDTVRSISLAYTEAISYAVKHGEKTAEVISNYEAAMDKARKDRDKPEPKSQAAKEAEREAARIRKQAEKDEQSLIDLKNKYLGKIEQTTEAEQKYRSILESDSYAKYSPQVKQAIKDQYEAAKAAELHAKGIEALTEVYKSWANINKNLESTSLDIANQNEDIKLQYELIGKIGDEYSRAKIQQELIADLNKAELSFEKERLNIVENYVQQMQKITSGSLIPGSDEFNAAVTANATAYEDSMKKADTNREATRVVAGAKANLKIVQDYEKKWTRIQDGISNALYDSLFEGGKKGAESIRKLIEDELKKEFVLPAIKVLVNYVTGAVGSFGNSVINGVLGTSSNNGGAGTNWLGLASNVSSLNTAYGALAQYVTGGAVGASTASLAYANGVGMVGGDSLGALYTANGGWAGVGVDGAASTGASTSGMGASTVGWIAAIVMGMYMSGDAWQKGIRWENYAKDDNAKKYDAEVGIRALHDAPARAIFGDDFVDSKLYAVLGGGSLSAQIHGAVQKGLWGGDWRPDGSDSRLSGTFSEASQGFDNGKISQDFTKDGGWFRKDKKETRSQDVTAGLDGVLDQMYRTIRNSMVMAGALFEDHTLADKLKDFTFSITDLSGSKLDESITKASDQLAEAMGKTLFPSIEAMRINVVDQAAKLKIDLEQAKRTGNVALASNIEAQIKNLEGLDNETWFSAFGRIMQDATAVGRVLDLMGESITDVFGEGNANRVLLLSESMAQMFGGIDNLNQSFSAYYANFYSQEEQRAKAMEDMGKAFTSLNLTMPTTREGFRALVDGLDLATVGGQSTFKALMDLQGAFASLTPTLEDASKAAAEASAAKERADIITAQKTAVENAYSALEKAVSSEKELIQTRLDTLENQKSNLLSFFDSLVSKIKEVAKQSEVMRMLSVDQSRAYLSGVVASGSITDTAKTSESVDVLIEDFNKGTYKSLVEEEKTRANLLISLTDISNITEDQLSEVERMIRVEKDQLTALDSILSEQRKLVDAALGIDTSILSVTAAINAMGSALASYKASVAPVASAPYSVSDSPLQRQAKVEYQTGVVVSPNDSANLAAAKVLYQSVSGGANTSEYNAALAGIGGSFNNIGWDGSIAGAKALVEKYGGSAFAEGGSYGGGLALVGEQGPELINFSNPGMVYTASQTGNILGDSSAVEELRALREEVAMLRYEARATATNTAKTAKLLDRNTEQDTIKVTIVADQTVS